MAVCTASLASGTRPVVLWRRLPTAARMQEGGAQEVLLEGSELTQTFDGEQYQFRGVDVLLPRGSKQGLVGVNGVGKSSLLRVLAGVDAPESGDVTVSRNARVAYVEQEPTLPAGSTAADFVYRADAPAMSALREFNAAAKDERRRAFLEKRTRSPQREKSPTHADNLLPHRQELPACVGEIFASDGDF